jgi:hypothetical protein
MMRLGFYQACLARLETRAEAASRINRFSASILLVDPDEGPTGGREEAGQFGTRFGESAWRGTDRRSGRNAVPSHNNKLLDNKLLDNKLLACISRI